MTTWRTDPALQGRFHAEFADDLRRQREALVEVLVTVHVSLAGRRTGDDQSSGGVATILMDLSDTNWRWA
jgi:hypothetical protein